MGREGLWCKVGTLIVGVLAFKGQQSDRRFMNAPPSPHLPQTYFYNPQQGCRAEWGAVAGGSTALARCHTATPPTPAAGPTNTTHTTAAAAADRCSSGLWGCVGSGATTTHPAGSSSGSNTSSGTHQQQSGCGNSSGGSGR